MELSALISLTAAKMAFTQFLFSLRLHPKPFIEEYFISLLRTDFLC